MTDKYYIGDTARVAFEFKPRLANGALGALTDPTTTRIKVQSPSKAERTFVYQTDAQVVKDATGQFHIDLPLTESGEYVVKGIGKGAVECGSPDQIIVVEKTRFKNPL